MTDILYNRTHETVFEENGVYVVGISYPGIKKIGKITEFKLPRVGDCFAKGEIFGWLESETAAAELYMPLAGRVVEVNNTLQDNLESLSDIGYDSMRLFSVESDSFSVDKEDLLSSLDYFKLAL